MNRYLYQPLNRVSGPKASKSQWVLYLLYTLVDVTFLVLALVVCNGRASRVKWWLLVKSVGTVVFRLVLFLEFIAHLVAYLEFRSRLARSEYRLKHYWTDPSVPRYDWLPILFATFEVVCLFGMISALTSPTVTQSSSSSCHAMILTAAICTAFTLVKYVTCIYTSCLQCRPCRNQSHTNSNNNNGQE